MSSTAMFSSKQTCDVVGISYRQLDYWARQGYFQASEAAQGSGSRRQYSFSDLVHLRVIKKMLDSGMKLQDVKRATDYLAAQGQDISNADLIMTSNAVFLHDANQPEALVDLMRTGQGVFTIVALSQAFEEVSQKTGSDDSAPIESIRVIA